ncbi:MAG: hypothetical protein COX80_00860 [Candidatus Magasanikbacteria bacterium CG_4_10_14_0_2_um_filter_33_14]|uniref:Uncharacterized protein n=1 Tax=Candidatus Magasanikbacteria bacterium CG_4_10_14_0_2_um_filter_33_14 TaxID=1974636 RepID=A0A2M7VC12_9BACT|nr:MAG: hypothetical protein COX80_00860 [Candidatus Magasanikbacteria bacterium CG_4_10_14_0_2_um_filter_33_14]
MLKSNDTTHKKWVPIGKIKISKQTKHKFNDFLSYMFNLSIEELKKDYFDINLIEFSTIILKTHLFIENLINEIIEASFVNSKKVIKTNFSNKINLLESVGFDSTFIEKIKYINYLRNKFSHNYKYILNQKEIKKIIDDFNYPNVPGEENFNIKEKVFSNLVAFIGEIGSRLRLEKELPFFSTILRQEKLYKNDKGFNKKDLHKIYNLLIRKLNKN